jgi:glycosyltransferase involved in cell wall biosynthesis
LGHKVNLLIFNLKTDADDDVLGFTTDWINGLAAHCQRVHVITMSAGRIAVATNADVFSVGKERGYSELRRAVEFYRLLARLLNSERIDACFAHMMPLFAILGWPLLRMRRIPIVLWYAHAHVPLMLRLATKLVDRVVASSRSGFQVSTNKLRIIGQGIDVERFCPPPQARTDPDRFVLLTVGRIAPVKRLELLVRALRQLPERLAGGRLVVARFVGKPLTERDRDYADQLRQLAAELGVGERVEFVPPFPFPLVDHAYRDADLFVNCSDTDSVDKTVLEAMSTGLPVVTSNAAFADVFEPAHARFCYIKRGDIAELADALRRFIGMEAQSRRAFGLALRETVCRNHSLRQLCTRMIAQIEETVKRKPA